MVLNKNHTLFFVLYAFAKAYSKKIGHNSFPSRNRGLRGVLFQGYMKSFTIFILFMRTVLFKTISIRFRESVLKKNRT